MARIFVFLKGVHPFTDFPTASTEDYCCFIEIKMRLNKRL